MGGLSLRHWLLRVCTRGAVFGAVACACGAAVRVPPGPEPEYQRPEVIPWEGGVAQVDPLAAIEADGEWVDDDMGEGGAPGVPSPEPLPANAPKR